MARATNVLYVDLDGTVRQGLDELGRFVNGPEDVRVFPEVPRILRMYKTLGWRIVAVSNQGGVALGHVSLVQVQAAMAETDYQCGHIFDRMAFCVHHPDADEPEMAICWCRKPRVGLILESAFDLGRQYQDEYYPPHLALLVGDMEEDRLAAEGANIPFQWARGWRERPLKMATKT